jgi:hypothetical protein
MTKLIGRTVLGVALLAGACSSSSSGTHNDGAAGSDGSGDTAGGAKITVSGVASVHPLAALAPPTTLVGASLVVAAIDPARASASGPPTPLAAMALDTSSGNCANGAAMACGFSLSNVDISTLSLGLVGLISEPPGSDGGTDGGAGHQWVSTGTGIASEASVTQHIASKAPLTGTQLFAVSVPLENKLVDFVNAVNGNTAIAHGGLEARGFMIGQVLGRISEGAAPVAGATVSIGTTASQMDIIYPNDTFSGAGTSTNSSGVFLGIPHGPTMVVASFTVTGPAGGVDGGTLTWAGGLAGSNPNSAFIIIFAADETNGGG